MLNIDHGLRLRGVARKGIQWGVERMWLPALVGQDSYSKITDARGYLTANNEAAISIVMQVALNV